MTAIRNNAFQDWTKNQQNQSKPETAKSHRQELDHKIHKKFWNGAIERLKNENPEKYEKYEAFKQFVEEARETRESQNFMSLA